MSGTWRKATSGAPCQYCGRPGEHYCKQLPEFLTMVPGVFCTDCGVIAVQKGDYYCGPCRADFEQVS